MLTRELLDKFLADRQRETSPATVRFYRGRLKCFCAAFGSRDFSSLTYAEIQAHLDQAGAGRSDSTRRHNIVALCVLAKWAAEQELCPEAQFWAKLAKKKPRVGRRERLPTAEETAALLRRASPEFAAIYTALRQSGARPGELCRARIEDLDPQRLVITLTEHKTARKTGRARKIPVGGRLRKLVAAAIGERTTGPIFLSPSGQAWQVENLSRTYTRLRKAAGLTEGLVLYLARHECGSTICKEKGIEAARQVLGHSSIQTTTRYVHFADKEIAALQDSMDAGDDPLPKAA